VNLLTGISLGASCSSISSSLMFQRDSIWPENDVDTQPASSQSRRFHTPSSSATHDDGCSRRQAGDAHAKFPSPKTHRRCGRWSASEYVLFGTDAPVVCDQQCNQCYAPGNRWHDQFGEWPQYAAHVGESTLEPAVCWPISDTDRYRESESLNLK